MRRGAKDEGKKICEIGSHPVYIYAIADIMINRIIYKYCRYTEVRRNGGFKYAKHQRW